MSTKLFAGSFFVLSLLLTGAAVADAKPKDCCQAKLACCKENPSRSVASPCDQTGHFS